MDPVLIDQTPNNPHFGKFNGVYLVREKAREAFRDHWHEQIPHVGSWTVDQIDEAIWNGF
jgi:hypothetical protein